MRKLATIRTNADFPCPFGLDISSACQVAGSSIDNMQQTLSDDSDFEQIQRQNIKLLAANPEQIPCKYAVNLFKHKPKAVDCDYGDSAAGISSNIQSTGPSYYKPIGEGFEFSGVLTFPTIPNNNAISYDNIYHGMLQLSQARHFKRILREALVNSIKLKKQ